MTAVQVFNIVTSVPVLTGAGRRGTHVAAFDV